MADHATALSNLLGAKGWLTGNDTEPFRRDWLNRFGLAPLGVARPSDTAGVAGVLRVCHKARIAVVPQGGNTSLCGGAVAYQYPPADDRLAVVNPGSELNGACTSSLQRVLSETIRSRNHAGG